MEYFNGGLTRPPRYRAPPSGDERAGRATPTTAATRQQQEPAACLHHPAGSALAWVVSAPARTR